MSLAGKSGYVTTRSSLAEFCHSQLRNVTWNEKKIAEKSRVFVEGGAYSVTMRRLL